MPVTEPSYPSPAAARDMLSEVEAIGSRSTRRPRTLPLLLIGAALGAEVACAVAGTAAQVGVALVLLLLVMGLSWRWLRRPGVRADPLAGPDTSWQTVLLTLAPSVWIPSAGVLRGVVTGRAGMIVGAALGLVAAAHFFLAARHLQRRRDTRA